MKALLLVLLAGSAYACGDSPMSPSDLPCNIYVGETILPDGTRFVHWANALGEDCSSLKPVLQ